MRRRIYTERAMQVAEQEALALRLVSDLLEQREKIERERAEMEWSGMDWAGGDEAEGQATASEREDQEEGRRDECHEQFDET